MKNNHFLNKLYVGSAAYPQKSVYASVKAELTWVLKKHIFLELLTFKKSIKILGYKTLKCLHSH